MAASPPPTVPPLVRVLCEVREILERARRTGDERAIERINRELDGQPQGADGPLGVGGDAPGRRSEEGGA